MRFPFANVFPTHVFLALVAGALTACAAPAFEELASTSAPILNGNVEPTVSGVVGVLDLDRGVLCSGVLVTDRAIVTARHCVAPLAPDVSVIDCGKTAFGMESAASRVVVTTSNGEASPTSRHPVEQVVVPEGDGYCGGDLAVLVLAEPLTAAEARPIELRLDRSVAPGETFSAIGIGRTEQDPSGTRRRRDGLHVRCVGADCRSTLIDGHEWWGEGAVCEGDSGGPALDGEGRVVGIASRKRAGCSATIYADVATSGAFLRTALGLADTTELPRDQASCSVGTANGGACAPFVAMAVAALVVRRRRAVVAFRRGNAVYGHRGPPRRDGRARARHASVPLR